MTADIPIPPEVVEAAASEYTSHIYKGQATTAEFRIAIRAAIAAGLAAWPGMEKNEKAVVTDYDKGEIEWRKRLILPLPEVPHDR